MPKEVEKKSAEIAEIAELDEIESIDAIAPVASEEAVASETSTEEKTTTIVTTTTTTTLTQGNESPVGAESTSVPSPIPSPRKQIPTSPQVPTSVRPADQDQFVAKPSETVTTIVTTKKEEVVTHKPAAVSSPDVETSSVLSVYSSYPYKSTISPRHTVISRRSGDISNTRVQTALMYPTSSYNSSLVSAAIQTRPSTGVLKETRQKEKRELGELNDRFAGYVERVRFLEAQNKKLQLELGVLKSKWGMETKQIEKMYQIELDEARSVLNDTSKIKDTVQVLDYFKEKLFYNSAKKMELQNKF